MGCRIMFLPRVKKKVPPPVQTFRLRVAANAPASFEAGNVSPLTGKAGQIFDALEQRFARGDYKFGEPLSAAELAAEFNVSRQPIAVALNQLRAAGYVIVTAQVGCKVVCPSSDEIRDFFQVYGRMEGTMAALAAVRHGAGEVGVLEDICRAIEAAPPPRSGLPDHYAELVGEWHSAIRLLARSPTLTWRLATFWRMSDFYLWNGAPNLSPERIGIANEQRRSITRAIAARDSEHAERLMYTHMREKPLRVGIVSETDMNTSAK